MQSGLGKKRSHAQNHQTGRKFRAPSRLLSAQTQGLYSRRLLRVDAPHQSHGGQTSDLSVERTGEWIVSELEFTAPAWGPFINVVFQVEDGVALMDDFEFIEI